LICSKCNTEGQDGSFCTLCGASLLPAVSVMPTQAVNFPQQDGRMAYGQGLAQPSYTNTYLGGQLPAQVNQGYGFPPATNGKAIASFILSLLGISLLGVIFGHIASSEIRSSAGRQGGSGFATAGLVLGWLGMVGWFLFWILYFEALNSIGYY
jgi:hypothetical protein